MNNDLKNFLGREMQGFKPLYSYSEVEEILEKYHNFVLDLVEKEVEKKKQYGDTKDAYEFVLSTKDISTIINNLRV